MRVFFVFGFNLLRHPHWGRNFPLLGVSAYPNCPVQQYNSYPGEINDDFQKDPMEGGGYDGSGSQYYPDAPYAQEWYPGINPMPKDRCTDPTSNARGRYNSFLAPCVLAFHKDSGEKVRSPYSLSMACTDDNIIADPPRGNISSATLPPVMREYIQNWPDECVGDFRRCYEIPVHERIYFNAICRMGWQFPDGATHMSMNCSQDKAAQLAAVEKSSGQTDSFADELAAQQKLAKDEMHEMEKFFFLLLATVLLSCMGCLCAAYGFVIRPYQDSFLRTNRSEKDGLVLNSDQLSEVEMA